MISILSTKKLTLTQKKKFENSELNLVDKNFIKIKKIAFQLDPLNDICIFTSKNAIDHYFRLAEEMRFSVPDNMRYICQSEAIANYLQKHIIYRKRKISFGEKSMADLLPLFKKHHDEKYLLPCSDVVTEETTKIIDQSGIDWTKAVMYRTVASDLSDVKIEEYDMLVFFSHQGIKSLFHNFLAISRSFATLTAAWLRWTSLD